MKFSIITPVYNSAKFIKETIESVLSQEGDFEIEYIVMDGGSTDRTIDIVKSYDKKILAGIYPIKCNGVAFKWLSGKDAGMYDAINKGFQMATGNIYAWINSDDFYLPEAFLKISFIFKNYPEVDWLKGKTALMNNPETGALTRQSCHLFKQEWIKRGIYGRYLNFINQDSVFWKKELWQKIGSIDNKLKLAGDYYLWVNMAKYAKLYSLNSEVSCYRRMEGSLGQKSMEMYRKEQEKIIPLKKTSLETKIKSFSWFRRKIGSIIPHSLVNLIYKSIFPKTDMVYFDLDESGQIVEKHSPAFEIK